MHNTEFEAMRLVITYLMRLERKHKSKHRGNAILLLQREMDKYRKAKLPALTGSI